MEAAPVDSASKKFSCGRGEKEETALATNVEVKNSLEFSGVFLVLVCFQMNVQPPSLSSISIINKQSW